MHINFMIVIIAALVPMIMGFIWYNPKVLGTAWMKAADVSQEKMKGGNMPLIFILSFVFSFLLAMEMQFITIHQYHLYSMLAHYDVFNPASTTPEAGIVKDLMAKYGNEFRTFKHGALHGTIAGIMFVLPIIATSAMFERKGFKYIAINAGYWIITIAIMGGLVCAFP